ncbi:hypothetical protein C8F04DRAFT_459311 [Mycena alexandri]|uniref:SAP domain-containing protein n=1 Tax=Mycena alexandri TaxID=1745969 RepID=A0AAD6RY45_9AGAR|nr:hypothetical protein C8F04DRAFT_459311 [Mycena alexandri]
MPIATSVRRRRVRSLCGVLSMVGVGLRLRGNIKTLKLSPLQDLAWSLDLEESGTREVIIARVNAHFDLPDNVHLKDDARYAGLFGRRRRRAGSTSDSPAEPAPTPQPIPAHPPSFLQNIVNIPPFAPTPVTPLLLPIHPISCLLLGILPT